MQCYYCIQIQKCHDDSELRVSMAIEEAAYHILQTGYRKPLSSVAQSDKKALYPTDDGRYRVH